MRKDRPVPPVGHAHVHTIPVCDYQHHVAASDCWCHPVEVTRGQWTHNALDCREARERAGNPGLPWANVYARPTPLPGPPPKLRKIHRLGRWSFMIGWEWWGIGVTSGDGSRQKYWLHAGSSGFPGPGRTLDLIIGPLGLAIARRPKEKPEHQNQ